MTVSILVPVLARPQRVEPLLASLVAAGTDPRVDPANLDLVFICNRSDDAEIDAVRAVGLDPVVVPWDAGRGDYAKKLNLCFAASPHEWFFFAADDLVFHDGWLAFALAAHRRTGACVIGTNDLGNQRTVAGVHSTHTLVNRDYADCGTVDDGSRILHEGYDHNYVDDEFVQTAKVRHTYAHAEKAVVEHFHPDWGKGEMDSTYRKGKARFEDDHRLYLQRKILWLGR